MIVVADTSPLNYLVQLARIDLLELFYGRILVPHAVLDELLHSGAPPTVRAWAQNPPPWLELLSPSTKLTHVKIDLDAGEAEAIALAEQLNADWLLIDEADGRDEATRRGLRTIGTLGILRHAHRRGLLDFRTEANRLQKAGFFVSDDLIEKIADSLT